MTQNLPALASRIGGNLPVVLQWEQHALLPMSTQYAITKIVAANPKLNTESRVDLLADMASWYGESIDDEVAELIGEYGPEKVYMVIDFLYEIGRRDRVGGSRVDLNEAIVSFTLLELAGVNLEAFDYVERLIESLGGLTAVSVMGMSDLNEALESNNLTEEMT